MSDSDRIPSSSSPASAAPSAGDPDAGPDSDRAAALPPAASPGAARARLELTDPELHQVYADVCRGAVVRLGSPASPASREHVELYSLLLTKLRVADAELGPDRPPLPEFSPAEVEFSPVEVAGDRRPSSRPNGVSTETHCPCGAPWDAVTEDYSAVLAGESPRRVQVTCLAGHDASAPRDRFGVVGAPLLAEDAELPPRGRVLDLDLPPRPYSPQERDLLRHAMERERHEAALIRLRGERSRRQEELAARLSARL